MYTDTIIVGGIEIIIHLSNIPARCQHLPASLPKKKYIGAVLFRLAVFARSGVVVQHQEFVLGGGPKHFKP